MPWISRILRSFQIFQQSSCWRVCPSLWPAQCQESNRCNCSLAQRKRLSPKQSDHFGLTHNADSGHKFSYLLSFQCSIHFWLPGVLWVSKFLGQMHLEISQLQFTTSFILFQKNWRQKASTREHDMWHNDKPTSDWCSVKPRLSLEDLRKS